MKTEFSISPEWSSAEFGPSEVRETSAFLTIRLGGHLATRAEDDWSKSVRTNVRVSAYPLALWLAASWWRLRWEPSFESARTDLSWRMAHEASAAGYGFVWPRLVFESDGENVEATCSPSSPAATEPLRYLENFRVSISSRSFEQTIEQFISLVIARLDAVGFRGSELQSVWEEVKEEQRDPETAAYRRYEARLGFEPDEAPEDLLDNVKSLAARVGEDAMLEVVPACSGENPKAALKRVEDLAEAQGVEGKLEAPRTVARVIGSPEYKSEMPWERGRRLAHSVRTTLGLGDTKLSNPDFCEILGIPKGSLEGAEGADRLPLGLAVRVPKSDRWKLVFRRRARTGRRFEAARLLGDRLIASVTDQWLPTTDAKTVRQKIQRAFAAEFLCPIASLKYWLQGDYSLESIEDAGAYFDVSPLAIRSHLANHGLIHPAEVMP